MTKRVFSPRCGKCKQRTMQITEIPYDIKIHHDGREYEVHIPNLSAPKCSNCGKISIDDGADQEIDNAFREAAGLYTPEQIRAGRQKVGYTNQQEFADCLGIAVETVSRWENGAQVPERFRNEMMEAFFEVPEFRRFLEMKRRECGASGQDDAGEVRKAKPSNTNRLQNFRPKYHENSERIADRAEKFILLPSLN